MGEAPNFGIQWLDSADIQQSSNKISEEAVKRVQEQGKKAKQAQKAIKDDRQTNTNIAKFLSFLLKNINNNRLTHLLYNTFFKVQHPHNNITYLRKTINSKVIAGLFIPFYTKKAQEYNIIQLYQDILTKPIKSIEDFTTYLKKLATVYHDKIPLDKESLILLVTECCLTYIPSHTDQNTNERKQLIQLEVSKHLYGKS